jgi:hypothetical protein
VPTRRKARQLRQTSVSLMEGWARPRYNVALMLKVSNMLISRSFTVDDWKALTFGSEVDWEKAVTMFLDRMETRYLEHIRRILRRRTSGFAALALDCAVIEMMEQFRRGEPKTPSGKGKKFFVSFLTETSFSPDVSKEQARVFYKNIRCGLLHQTEAEDSLVKRNNTRPIIAFTNDHKGVVVNAKVFHQRLEQVIREYAENLKDPKSEKEREAFRTKMNFICRIEGKRTEGQST